MPKHNVHTVILKYFMQKESWSSSEFSVVKSGVYSIKTINDKDFNLKGKHIPSNDPSRIHLSNKRQHEILEISKDAIFTLLKVVTPVVLVALIIGLVVGIFQALTQIQEMTLAFVPKILGVFLSLVLLFPFMLNQMKTLSDTLFDKIVNGG